MYHLSKILAIPIGIYQLKLIGLDYYVKLNLSTFFNATHDYISLGGFEIILNCCYNLSLWDLYGIAGMYTSCCKCIICIILFGEGHDFWEKLFLGVASQARSMFFPFMSLYFSLFNFLLTECIGWWIKSNPSKIQIV